MDIHRFRRFPRTLRIPFLTLCPIRRFIRFRRSSGRVVGVRGRGFQALNHGRAAPVGMVALAPNHGRVVQAAQAGTAPEAQAGMVDREALAVPAGMAALVVQAARGTTGN